MYNEKNVKTAVFNLGLTGFDAWALGPNIQEDEKELLKELGIYDEENHTINHAMVVDIAICG